MLTIDERSKRLRGKITTSTTYALWFFGLGIYVPYFPIWLHDRGFDAATIGVLLAVPMVVRILATAPITRLGDSRLGARRAFLLIASGATLVYSGLFFAWGFWPIAVVLALMSVFVAPGVPLLDVIVLNGVVTHGYDYGRIRFWGSAAWLAANLAGGAILGQLPPSAIPPILAVLAALSVFAGLTLPDDSRRPARASTEISAGPSLRLFWLFSLAVALLQGAHAFLLGFSTLMWQRMGYSEPQIGLLWGVGITLETLFFLFAGSTARRVGPYAMIATGAVVGLARWLFMAQEPTSAIAISLLQSTHFLTFAAVHLGTMNWLGRYEGGRAGRTGILATAISAAMAIATVASGWLYQHVGSHGFYAMAALSALGLTLILFIWREERRV